mmetsp:Transcript_27538/g.107870  ORF Transcript_27538/g.107870 Transcript_27538/m.107870 type:complete len:116 (-) Transcript_27538:1610-1957(-)
MVRCIAKKRPAEFFWVFMHLACGLARALREVRLLINVLVFMGKKPCVPLLSLARILGSATFFNLLCSWATGSFRKTDICKGRLRLLLALAPKRRLADIENLERNNHQRESQGTSW